jgi:hypothetical protein
MRINRVKKNKKWLHEDFMVCTGLQLVVISLMIYQQVVDRCEILRPHSGSIVRFCSFGSERPSVLVRSSSTDE